MRRLHVMAAVAALALCVPAWGHGDAAGKPSAKTPPQPVEDKSFGRAGDPKKVTRAISVDMSDAMRFAPTEIRIAQGETVRFVVRNSGKMTHEMVLGTMRELKEHAELMKKHPGMEHDEPYMIHVAPGRTERIVWQFTRAGEFHYGCLIPGHFEAGMTGRINVSAR